MKNKLLSQNAVTHFFYSLSLMLLCTNLSWGQTPISITNGDFSSGSTLTGISPWTITGWTISENIGLSSAGNANLTVGSSGVISGALTATGTNSTAPAPVTANLNQAALIVESDKIDISSYAGTTSAFTYGFQIKVATATTTAAPWNVVVKVYDANNTEVLLAVSQTKVQGNLKSSQTPAGTYINATAVGTLLGAGSATVKYITIQVHLGQMLANTPTLDNFTLNVAAAAASTTLAQPASTALSYTLGAGPSASQSFTVAGDNLGTNNITVAPGANIELSSDNSTFASSTITLTPTSGTVATTTLYARLIAGIGIGSGGSGAARQVNVNATGTTQKQIQFTGSINGIINTSPTNATLSYNFGSGPSAEESYSVEGYGLTGNLVVTAGSNVEVSTTSGSGFSSSVTLTPTSGVVAATTVYVRLNAGLAEATYNDATTAITTSSTGFTDVVRQFKGTVASSLGINDVEFANNTISLFPNPAQEVLNVSSSNSIAKIEVYDLLGKKVASNNNAKNVNVAALGKGVYVVKVAQENGSVVAKRFIKQ
jgi:hypothetical protein